MNVGDILKNKGRAILSDFEAGEEVFESPVAYAVTGDAIELEKLVSVDFTKLKIVRHQTCEHPDGQPLEWSETTRTSDGYAICFDEYSEFPLDIGDAHAISCYVN